MEGLVSGCRICDEPDCAVIVRPDDRRIVAAGLRNQYGRSLPWSLRELAAEVLHEVTEAGRLGNSTKHDNAWEPAPGDAYDFGGPLANYHGEMRLWRAEEIGYWALLALGRAGRLRGA